MSTRREREGLQYLVELDRLINDDELRAEIRGKRHTPVEVPTYPTIRGVPVSPLELYDLTDSRLDLEAQRNFNLHHSAWTRKMFGRNILMLTFRQLENNQLFMPVDIHDQLHQEYDPPVMPTPLEAITEIERARDAGERMRIRQPAKKIGKYTLEVITDEHFARVKASYDTLKRGHR